jgi:hypothetical protein
MTTSNSIVRAIVTIFNNSQCHCQFKIMNFNIEQRISIIQWYYPAKEGRSGRTAAVRCRIISVQHILIGYNQHLAPFFESIVR